MKCTSGLLPALIAVALSLHSWAGTQADTGKSTRVTDDKQYTCVTDGSTAYREKSAYVLRELDLKPGDVVVDVGAGDAEEAQLAFERSLESDPSHPTALEGLASIHGAAERHTHGSCDVPHPCADLDWLQR